MYFYQRIKMQVDGFYFYVNAQKVTFLSPMPSLPLWAFCAGSIKMSRSSSIKRDSNLTISFKWASIRGTAFNYSSRDSLEYGL